MRKLHSLYMCQSPSSVCNFFRGTRHASLKITCISANPASLSRENSNLPSILELQIYYWLQLLSLGSTLIASFCFYLAFATIKTFSPAYCINAINDVCLQLKAARTNSDTNWHFSCRLNFLVLIFDSFALIKKRSN